MNIHNGDQAPQFTLPDQTGTEHALSEYLGKWVLLYFYPKDDTPGCTTEACTLRDNFPKFDPSMAIILGVSKDSVKSHAKFAEKYKLPFTLLADESGEVCDSYEVSKLMGVSRTSFLIDPQGKIAKIYEHVKPAEHAEEVLHDIQELKQ